MLRSVYDNDNDDGDVVGGDDSDDGDDDDGKMMKMVTIMMVHVMLRNLEATIHHFADNPNIQNQAVR